MNRTKPTYVTNLCIVHTLGATYKIRPFYVYLQFNEPVAVFGLGGGLGGSGGRKSELAPGTPFVSFRHASVMASASPSQ